MRNKIELLSVVLAVLFIIWNISVEAGELQSSDRCLDRLDVISACCVELNGVDEVVVRDHDGVIRVVPLADDYKRIICKKINNVKEA